MEFRVLGPVQMGPDHEQSSAMPRQQRCLLAVLISHANTPVSTDRLVQALWEFPPASAGVAIRKHVSALRAVLGADRLLHHDQGGYRLVIADGELDAHRFAALTAAGAQAAENGDPAEADRSFTAAVDLWRGPAYADVADLLVLRPEIERLEQARLHALEQRSQVRLELGRHQDLVAELAALVAEHPLRERLRGQYMIALYRCGRPADALDTYRRLLHKLGAELGLEPGPGLATLNDQILRKDPSLRSPSTTAGGRRTPRPAELPRDVPVFIGRAEEIVRLRDVLSEATDGPMVVAAIAGAGGIGKSALAVHVGHQVAQAFADGHLYVDLQGATPNVRPLEPGEALARMLRSLGVDDASIPSDTEEAAARFRSVTSGMRLLILLDNARDETQIRPLIPGHGGCGVVVTSRHALSGLEGAYHGRLDVLGQDEALTLLARLIGDQDPDQHDAARVVQQCGSLPLAICVAAARFRARPAWTLRTLADRLADQGRRLSVLEAGDRGVRMSCLVSYHELGSAHRRMFRLCGLFAITDISVPVASALAGVAEHQAEAILDDLVEIHLLQCHAPGRYRFHDLVRLFARERADMEDPEGERTAAVRRGLHHYLATARNAHRTVTSSPQLDLEPLELLVAGRAFTDGADVFAWVGEEVANVHALVDVAGGLGHAGARYTIALASVLNVVLDFRGLKGEQLKAGRHALEAAERTGELLDRAVAHHVISDALKDLGDPAMCLLHARQARADYREVGHTRGEANRLTVIGIALRVRGEYAEAFTAYQESLVLNRKLEHKFGVLRALTNMGLLHVRMGDFRRAVEAHRESLAIALEINRPHITGSVLSNLAEALRRSGRPSEGLDFFRRAQASAARDGPDSYGAGEIWWGMGWCHHDLGESEQARGCWRQAAIVLHRLGLIGEEERRTIEEAAVPETPQIIRQNQ